MHACWILAYMPHRARGELCTQTLSLPLVSGRRVLCSKVGAHSSFVLRSRVRANALTDPMLGSAGLIFSGAKRLRVVSRRKRSLTFASHSISFL